MLAFLQLLAQSTDTLPVAVCGESPGVVCRLVYEWTGNDSLARVMEWIVVKPLKVLLIIAIAVLLSRLLRRGIRRLVSRLAAQREAQARAVEESVSSHDERGAARVRRAGERRERAQQRAQALGTVLRSLASVIVWGVGGLLVLGEFGINLGPLLAGAGIVGIALGFGAQTLVRDFLSGLFMLGEDQFGVGDIVDLGEASGVVEEVRLRTTRLRDLQGNVWFIPNGEVRRVANKSQLWARAVVDVSISAEADLDRATGVIKATADAIWHDRPSVATVLEEPSVLGLEAVDEASATLRVLFRVEPGAQWTITRLARRRFKDALAAAGIEPPHAQQTVLVRFADAEPVAGA